MKWIKIITICLNNLKEKKNQQILFLLIAFTDFIYNKKIVLLLFSFKLYMTERKIKENENKKRKAKRGEKKRRTCFRYFTY